MKFINKNSEMTTTKNFAIHKILRAPFVDFQGEVHDNISVFTITATHKDDALNRKAVYTVYIEQDLIDDEYYSILDFIDERLLAKYEELTSK